MIRTVSHGPRVSRQPAPIRLWLWALVSMVLLWLNMTSARANESVNFSLPGLDGKTYALAAFRGQWVVVNFWATWCGTCVDEMAALESFAVANKDAQVLAVNFEDIEPDQLRAFVHALKTTFPIVLVGESRCYHSNHSKACRLPR